MKHRISPSLILSILALFFSLGGVGMAATGYRITSIFQIAPKARAQLQGATGPVGPQGLAGTPGQQGIPGTQGPVGADGPPGASGGSGAISPLTFDGDSQTIPAGQEATMNALCPSERALSGGYDIAPGLEVITNKAITQNMGLPYPRTTGWTITLLNPTGTALTASLSVNCA